MVLKVPPPPTLPQQFQQLNRWLIELQSILNSQGTVDPSNVDGLPALAAQVATNTAGIAANTANIAANTAGIAANTANIATNTANIATLTARNQILNGSGAPSAGLGNNDDLYINNTGSGGTRLYAKIAGSWVALA
jgi:hypothetical protein